MCIQVLTKNALGTIDCSASTRRMRHRKLAGRGLFYGKVGRKKKRRTADDTPHHTTHSLLASSRLFWSCTAPVIRYNVYHGPHRRWQVQCGCWSESCGAPCLQAFKSSCLHRRPQRYPPPMFGRACPSAIAAVMQDPASAYAASGSTRTDLPKGGQQMHQKCQVP
jgi:hypothetical protein